MAQLYDRSPAAIEARLLKLGKIDAAALTVRLRYGAATTVSKSASGRTASKRGCPQFGEGTPLVLRAPGVPDTAKSHDLQILDHLSRLSRTARLR